MKTYEIDICADISFSDINKSFADYNLVVEYYKRVGPGGGNPNYIVSGQPSDFAAWNKNNYSDENPETFEINPK